MGKVKLSIIQTILLITALYFVFANDKINKPITIGLIADSNQLEIRAFNLYRARLNKYGGIDNSLLRFVLLNGKDSIRESMNAVIDLKSKKAILYQDKNTSFIIDKKISLMNLNYRMSATVSDCKRKFDLEAIPRIISKLKALDIVIASIEQGKPIKDHPYFNSDLNNPKVNVDIGIAMVEITDIDLDNVEYTMDFYIWFRSDENLTVKIDDIIFTNAIKPFRLLESNESKLIIDTGIYKKYRVKARFKALEKKNYALGEQNLAIRFRHTYLPTTEIHYQRDVTDNSNGIYSTHQPTTHKESEALKFGVIKHSSLTLNYTLQYSTYTDNVAYGMPESITYSNVPMSEFTYRYAVKHILFSFRGLENVANNLFNGDRKGQIVKHVLVAYILFSLFLFIGIDKIFKARYNPITTNASWFLKLVIMNLLLLCGEFLVSQCIFDIKNSMWGNENQDILETAIFLLQYATALMLWIIPAIYVVSALDQFVWCPIEQNTKTEVPKVLKLFVSMLIYALTLIGILAYVFEVTTNSLMATSGAFAILFAVLSKVDISNIVAGLGISFAKIFKLGDWVKINGQEGQVIEMTARSTKLLTVDNTVINIPNTNVGEAIIENTACPTDAFRMKIHLEIVPMSIAIAESALMDGVLRTEGVLETPKPFVNFLGQGDSAQIYEVYFFIENYSRKSYIQQKVWRNVWESCEFHKVIMATPQREHFIFNQ